MTQPPHYTHVPPPEPQPYYAQPIGAQQENPYYAQPIGDQQYRPNPNPPKKNWTGIAVLGALIAVGATVAVATSDSGESDYSADSDSSSFERVTSGGGSGLSADEREFLRDFRDFADGSYSDTSLILGGEATCEYLNNVNGYSDSAQLEAAEITHDATDMSMNDSMALVSASVVNLCPEFY